MPRDRAGDIGPGRVVAWRRALQRERRPESESGRRMCLVGQRVDDSGGGGGVFGGGDFFFLGSVGASGSGAGSCGPGFTVPFAGGSGSPKITRAFAGRFRTAVGQSVGAACLL